MAELSMMIQHIFPAPFMWPLLSDGSQEWRGPDYTKFANHRCVTSLLLMSDMLLHFQARAPHKRLEFKVEVKFCTFSPPVIISGGMFKISGVLFSTTT